MSFLSKLFGHKQEAENVVGGLEDFKLLIQVYYQSCMAAQLGISNLGNFPQLRIFKQTYHVPTVNNKLGIGEKKRCRKIMQEIYNISDTFFTEIDGSIKKKCRKMQDANAYDAVYKGFLQDLSWLMGNLMQWKSKLPKFMSKVLREIVAKQVHEVMTSNNWKDESVRKSCIRIRKYQNMLGYSEQWMTELVYTLVMLNKKEPRKNAEE